MQEMGKVREQLWKQLLRVDDIRLSMAWGMEGWRRRAWRNFVLTCVHWDQTTPDQIHSDVPKKQRAITGQRWQTCPHEVSNGLVTRHDTWRVVEHLRPVDGAAKGVGPLSAPARTVHLR
ncbi:hypothetical protein CEXT_126291 [Caerostris extrusa]|uniref:Uncharacterized protein n=1 Tax=Caerostris extrusa TaxID=172846 RepID=A0AAV4XFK8_CAEEX|nr:hypothetical protein CEXT_126291 [Caerostris extrusa]